MSEHPSEQRHTLAVIVGSTREGRFAPVIANWFTRHAESHPHIDVDVIDLDAVGPYTLRPGTEAYESFAKRVDQADAFVVITPEYNHSFPAPLKHAIDLLRSPWQAKPVGFVSYGGISGGLRAVEQLRLVFAELHATTVRETVSFALPGDPFDERGELRDPAPAAKAADALLRQLTWWALALRAARLARPYGA
ncbi:NADPH-dependent FMN reductase [Streptomyces gilvosporeus]|uniref:NADPH-dependent FMN reductase n=1 Tax=Streptomyces gilvosporeus TaxID=553510 RepID=A0A1V0TVU5_9ACTN|nr:NAD(P)H-dependent oxidoreductase [Streptomyces gilvosporeus]ARF56822.1 NADPH-dependent FMN reductase [Streptomyces gilvosporeus]